MTQQKQTSAMAVNKKISFWMRIGKEVYGSYGKYHEALFNQTKQKHPAKCMCRKLDYLTNK